MQEIYESSSVFQEQACFSIHATLSRGLEVVYGKQL